MAETGIARFQGSLDPAAQEFRPRTQPLFQHQIHIFGPPPPPLQLPLYYPYTPISLGFPPPHQAYVNTTTTTVPSLPPQSAAPTRTLVLSSVPTHVSESIIRRELEAFGEVRGVQMERIHDGIVTVHFYDLRHAEIALKEIRENHMQQQTRLRNLFVASPSLIDQSFGFIGDSLLAAPPHTAARGLISGCAVWAQFIIPSSNAVPDGHNHGTIVVFNLDPNVSTPTLKEIFQAFGAVKELRETPLKKQQRFVEFWDVRDAAKALMEMNGKEIHGKQVVIEFSRPGGFGRKFFNATNVNTCNKTSSSIHNTFINAKLSTFAPPPPQPSQRQLPPPHSTTQPVQRSSHNIPPRAFQSSNFIKGNPSDESSNCSKDKIEGSVGCLSINGGDGNGVVDSKYGNGFASRRNNHAKKSQNDSGATTSTTRTTTTTTAKHQNRSSRPWKSSRQAKKFDTRFLINEDAMVESNRSDSRTTVMIKNIPNKYSQKLLLNMLDNHCIHCNEQIIADGGGGEDHPLSSYDFVYLPIDFNNKCNVGYGFVNMTSPQATLRLYKAFHHQHWEVFNSRKICEVTYARVQGLEALKEHFKNSKFPCEMDHYLPVVFSPPRDGRQLTEPQPIAGHCPKQQQSLIIFGLDIKHEDGENILDNSNSSGRDTDQDQDEEDNMNHISSSNSSSSQNGGDIGDE